jgi:hypothetical protein
MTRGTINYGIQVTGGTFRADNLAVGANARVTVNNAAAALEKSGRNEVLDKLNAVLAALEAEGAGLPDKESADELVSRIAKEAAAKKPDKLNLKGFLATLADEVKSVASIAGAVAALAGSIGGLFL